MKSHQLHHHLIGICGSVERAGPWRMIGTALGLQKLVFSNLAFGVKLPNPLLFLVWKSRWHRAAWNEHDRKMAKSKGSDQKPRDDLVADAKKGCSIEHSVAKSDGRSKCNDVAAEQ